MLIDSQASWLINATCHQDIGNQAWRRQIHSHHFEELVVFHIDIRSFALMALLPLLPNPVLILNDFVCIARKGKKTN